MIIVNKEGVSGHAATQKADHVGSALPEHAGQHEGLHAFRYKLRSTIYL